MHPPNERKRLVARRLRAGVSGGGRENLKVAMGVVRGKLL